ncbi:MAG TPA: hypothetical protein VIJ86_07240 [Acidimicrobiales bacterium]
MSHVLFICAGCNRSRGDASTPWSLRRSPTRRERVQESSGELGDAVDGRDDVVTVEL